MFDNVCKYLAENFSSDFATWLLGKPISLSKLSSSELSLEPIRADALMLLESENLFEISGMRHEFQVVRLWEEPPSLFLRTPGLLPLAVLAQTEDPSALLRQVADQIETIDDLKLQRNIAASSAILAGLRLDKALVTQILRQDIMQDSTVYQDILEKGREEGRQEGRREGEVTLALRLLIRRIGVLPEPIRGQIYLLSLPQLEALGDALVEFKAFKDLEDWLANQQTGIAKVLESLKAKFGELLPDFLVEVRQLSPEAVALLETELLNWSNKNELKGWLAAQNAQNDGLQAD
jgi:predicted transposase YdaD